MLTGRSHDAEAGQSMGISHYIVDAGTGLEKALEIAGKVSTNAPMTNFAVLHALPRIAEADPATGYPHGGPDGLDRAGRRRSQAPHS